jgi:hypothetical protein
MTSRRKAVSVIGLLALSKGALGQATADSQSTTSDLRIFKTYQEVVGASDRRIPSFDRGFPYFDGYSLKPFRPRQAAFDEAVEKAKKAKASSVLIVIDRDQQFPGSSPPPGSLSGGVYNVVGLAPVSYIEPTVPNLLTEIRRHVFQGSMSEHVDYLFILAGDPQYREAVPDLKTIIKSERSENLPANASAGLVSAIVNQESAAAADDLIRWSKYHKNPGIRLASYLGLLKIGRTKDVEDLVRNEPDKKVRAQVERKLL